MYILTHSELWVLRSNFLEENWSLKCFSAEQTKRLKCRCITLYRDLNKARAKSLWTPISMASRVMWLTVNQSDSVIKRGWSLHVNDDDYYASHSKAEDKQRLKQVSISPAFLARIKFFTKKRWPLKTLIPCLVHKLHVYSESTIICTFC